MKDSLRRTSPIGRLRSSESLRACHSGAPRSSTTARFAYPRSDAHSDATDHVATTATSSRDRWVSARLGTWIWKPTTSFFTAGAVARFVREIDHLRLARVGAVGLHCFGKHMPIIVLGYSVTSVVRETRDEVLVRARRDHDGLEVLARTQSGGRPDARAAARYRFAHSLAERLASAAVSPIIDLIDDVYASLACEVEHIFVNGRVDDQRVASGILVPISEAGNFFATLLKWNEESTEGQFVSVDADEVRPVVGAHRVIQSENPIKEVWARLRQLQSVKLAEKAISSRMAAANASLDRSSVAAKAQGLAFAVRNATDYFRLREEQSVSQRVLNLYYGSLSFAFAEMLAGPAGPKTLSEIENMTKQGHGLYTVDGAHDGIDALVVGVIASGFFPNWLAFLGKPVQGIPGKKPREHKDLATQAAGTFATLEQLFARIPELNDLFFDIFDGPPAWLHPSRSSVVIGTASLTQSSAYVKFVDRSGRFKREAVAALSSMLKEISEIASEEPGRTFRSRVDFPAAQTWDRDLSLHHSPFSPDALILPLFGSITEFRVIALALLYGLSIVVRYRPSIWRRVQEGDLDQFKVLIESFLAIVERVLPEQFLATISGVPVYARQQGASQT